MVTGVSRSVPLLLDLREGFGSAGKRCRATSEDLPRADRMICGDIYARLASVAADEPVFSEKPFVVGAANRNATSRF